MKFTNTYIDLGEPFFQRTLPEKVTSPKLLLWNSELANGFSELIDSVEQEARLKSQAIKKESGQTDLNTLFKNNKYSEKCLTKSLNFI